MRKTAFIISMLFCVMTIHAQNFEVKNNKIMVDGKAMVAIEKQGCGAVNPNCIYYIRDFAGKPLITIVEMELVDPIQKNQGNPEGKIRYLRFTFANDKGVAEIANPALFNTRPKDIAQLLVTSRLIKENELDEVEVQNFIQSHGAYYSDRRKELGKSIIIIKDDN